MHLQLPVPHIPNPALALIALGAATTIHYILTRKEFRSVDRRLCRMEDLGERIVDAETNVLAALRSTGDGAETAALRLLG